MKLLLLNLLLVLLLMPISAACQTYTNGVYVKNGKTFEVDKKVHQITTPETLHFSNGLIVQTSTNSDFMINSLFQEVFDIDKPPHFAKFGNSSFASTLMSGNATVSYSGTNENSSCVISTPMCDLELYKGTFVFNVTESRVVVFVIEGSLKVHSGKRKENTVTEGYAVIARPNDIGILEDKVSVGAEKVRSDMIKKLTDDAQLLLQTKGNIRFIIVNRQLIGLNIN